MSNKWKEIWSNRKIDLDKLDTKNEFELYSELKRLDGFDVQIEDEYLFYKALYDSIIGLHEEKLKDAESIFEVGCGSGANLILFKNRGKRVGGGRLFQEFILCRKGNSWKSINYNRRGG